jgi:hypothetical protein
MTEAPASASIPTGQAFDAALARGRAAMADPLPVLAKVDPERSAARDVDRLRGTLATRFAWADPVAKVATLHRTSLADMVRLERRFYWRSIRVSVADFLLTHWLTILGAVVVAGLVVVAVIFRDAIIASFSAMLPKVPTPSPTVTPPQTLPAPVQAPAGASPAGTTP